MGLIGYDLDGTLVPGKPARNKPYFRQTGPERKAYDVIRREHYKNAPLVRMPSKQFVLISGRPIRYESETLFWVDFNGLKPDGIYLMDNVVTRKNQIAHKIEVLRRLGISRYYEDDPKIARALTRLGISVILVERLTYESIR